MLGLAAALIELIRAAKRGAQRGQFAPGPQLKGAPHKKRIKYAVKINSNTLIECAILLFSSVCNSLMEQYSH